MRSIFICLLLLFCVSKIYACEAPDAQPEENSTPEEHSVSEEHSSSSSSSEEEEEGPIDEEHFLQVKYDEDIWFNEDSTPEISYHFFTFNKNKRPIILVQGSKVDGDKYYSVLMLDPDAPSHDDPKFADWLHWGLYNIPGDLFKYGALDVEEHAASGFNIFDVFAEYNPPTPPKKSGPHRYNFILLEQEGALIRVIPQTRDRANFSLTKYCDKYKMKEMVRATFTTENQ